MNLALDQNDHYLRYISAIWEAVMRYCRIDRNCTVVPTSQGTGFKGGLGKVELPLRRNGLWIYKSLCIAMRCGGATSLSTHHQCLNISRGHKPTRHLWVSTHDAFCPRRYAPSLSKVYKRLHISASSPIFIQAVLSPSEQANRDRRFYNSGGVDTTVPSIRL